MRKYLGMGILLSLTALYGANAGMKVYGKGCVECHGDDGRDVSVSPRAIAGSSGVYDKLAGYRDGTYGGEQKETMKEALHGLDDAALKAVSAYVEGL